jgi:CheY-like chemotaxis protein
MRTAENFVILVAEDDERDLILLQHALKDTNHTPNLQTVLDGEEVISYLSGEGEYADRRAHPYPDLLILDLKMPHLTGLEVLEWLKNYRLHNYIPTIMLSGSGMEQDVAEAYSLGVQTYFTKPASLEELRKLVQVLITYWCWSERPPREQNTG